MTGYEKPWLWPGLDRLLLAALEEDLGSGDVTTGAVVPADAVAEMWWVAKSPLLAAGLSVGVRVFQLLDGGLEAVSVMADGRAAGPGEEILRLRGRAAALLSGERVALNICQRLCGIATATREFANAVSGTRAVVAATRKTTPLLRRLEKHAVTAGGGVPHRFGLDDGVLIKDNHIEMAGSIREAVRRARLGVHHLLKIQVEATSLDQVEEAIVAGAELVLLDNMDLETMTRAVELAAGRALVEASGNITLDNIGRVAATGVDVISSGALTHSVRAADISARMRPL